MAQGHQDWKLHGNIAQTPQESLQYASRWISAIEQGVAMAKSLQNSLSVAKPRDYWDEIDAELTNAAAAGAELRRRALETTEAAEDVDDIDDGNDNDGSDGADVASAARVARLRMLEQEPEPETQRECKGSKSESVTL